MADNHGCFYPRKSKKVERFINYALDTKFTHEDMQIIYCRLGNRIRHDLTVKFVKSGYNLELLRRRD